MTPFDSVAGQLFPPFVVASLSPITDCATGWPEERAAVASAVPRRRREFLSGRRCAHVALRALGRDDGPVGVGAGRQPVWPPGVVGSISHGGGWSGAVVAAAADAWGLGFDVEELEPPLPPDVDRLVRSPAERHCFAGPTGRYAAKVAFSAKECVYKCLYPRTGWALGFHDVSVDLDLDGGRYRATVDRRFTGAEVDVAELEGRVVMEHGYVFTGLCVVSPRHGGGSVTG